MRWAIAMTIAVLSHSSPTPVSNEVLLLCHPTPGRRHTLAPHSRRHQPSHLDPILASATETWGGYHGPAILVKVSRIRRKFGIGRSNSMLGRMSRGRGSDSLNMELDFQACNGVVPLAYLFSASPRYLWVGYNIIFFHLVPEMFTRAFFFQPFLSDARFAVVIWHVLRSHLGLDIHFGKVWNFETAHRQKSKKSPKIAFCSHTTGRKTPK